MSIPEVQALNRSLTDEPKPVPTMGDALKGIQERLSQFPSRGEYGDNGVFGWFLGLEADNNELRAREQRIREAAFHPLFNSLESVATIKTILTLG